MDVKFIAVMFVFIPRSARLVYVCASMRVNKLKLEVPLLLFHYVTAFFITNPWSIFSVYSNEQLSATSWPPCSRRQP